MKKIMFNDKYGLTRAVLEGRKTMTRRAVKFPTKFDWGFYRYPLKPVTQEGYRAFVELLDEDEFSFEPERYASSQYAVGEIVAIAQSYKDVIEEWSKGCGRGFSFGLEDRAGMSNKMFVKPEYMPHHIQITSIRVQNLQDISNEDCLKEGVVKACIGYYVPGLKANWEKESHIEAENGQTWKLFPTPQEAFAALIDKVSGKGTWEGNPLVWVYEFKLID